MDITQPSEKEAAVARVAAGDYDTFKVCSMLSNMGKWKNIWV
jgi:hypothetical protein